MLCKVTKKLLPSEDCFTCGVNNPAGVHVRYYGMENGELAALLTFRSIHQSYPGRVHGGVITAVLDEAAGEALRVIEENAWGVTGEINVRFRKPVPYDVPLVVRARIVKNTKWLFNGEARLYLPSGEVADIAVAKYMRLPYDAITENGSAAAGVTDVLDDDDPKEIDMPEW